MTEGGIRKLKRELRHRWIDWDGNPGGVRKGHGISNHYRLLGRAERLAHVGGALEARPNLPVDSGGATRNGRCPLEGGLPATAVAATRNGRSSYPQPPSQQGATAVAPNLNTNLNPNPNRNLGGGGDAEAGSLATARDGGALASPPKPATDHDRWRAFQKEFGLEHVQLYKLMRDGTLRVSVGSLADAVSIQETLRAALLDRWPGVTDVKVMTLEEDGAKAAATG